MNAPGGRRFILGALVYLALSCSVVSSLGMLLVPTIAREMGVSTSTAQWMLTLNLLVGAVVTPILGRLSDGPHKRALLLIVIGIITAGSIIAAVATEFWVFLLGRALQGFAYAVPPMTIAFARRHLQPERVQHGISGLAVTVATGLGLGYPITGALAAAYGHSSAFWFATAFSVSAAVVVAICVPAGRDTEAAGRSFDFFGSAVLSVGLGALLLAVSEGGRWSWTSPQTIGTIAVAMVALAGWVVIELRVRHALIDLRLFRYGDVLIANAASIALGAAMYIALSIVSLIAQAPRSSGFGAGMPVELAGLFILPYSAGSLMASRLVRLGSRWVGARALLPLGAGLVTASTVMLVLAHRELWQVLVAMFIFGLGAGATFAAMPQLISNRVRATEFGSAVSFNHVLRIVGGSLGSAIAAAVLATSLNRQGEPTSEGIEGALILGAAMCAVIFVALTIRSLIGTWLDGRLPPDDLESPV